MHKFAGVTLDWYDDRGETLRQKFPTVEDLPEIIKTADIQSKEQLANEQFALIAIDGGEVMRKFACHDPGTTAMSVIYFMEHGDKLPEEAVKVAAANLTEACTEHGILPPETLTKLAFTGRVLPGMATGAAGGTIGGALGAPEGQGLTGATQGMGMGALQGALMGIFPMSKQMTMLGSGMGGVASGSGLAAAMGRGPRRAAETREELRKKREHQKLRQQYFESRKEKKAAAPAGIPPTIDVSTGGQKARAAYEGLKSRMSGLGGRMATSPWAHAALASGLGAGTAALTSDPEERAMGAMRGGAGGAIGGGLGAWGGAALLGPRGAAIGLPLGAIAGGLVSGSRQSEEAALIKKHDEARRRRFERANEERAAEREAMGIKTSEAIDITGQTPKTKTAAARPLDPSLYAVTRGGQHLYPIDTWDNVKLASDYWMEERIRMEPEMRREFATKLAARATAIGYPVPYEVADAGSTAYAPAGHLSASLEMRKVACPMEPEAQEFLEGLFEKRAELEPEVYAECLRRFDVEQGLHGIWDQAILDPWASTFAKEAAEVVWEQGADRVTETELVNLARNQGGGLAAKFTDEFIGEFEKDPIGMFNSMPDPQKKILSRMANDLASDGSSVMYSENVAYKSPKMSKQAK